jgi:hypothetical protein
VLKFGGAAAVTTGLAAATAAGSVTGTGTRTAVRQTGQRINCPACVCSADSDVRHIWHGKTIMTRTKS